MIYFIDIIDKINHILLQINTIMMPITISFVIPQQRKDIIIIGQLLIIMVMSMTGIIYKDFFR